jgi:hypothetical protein
MWMSARPPSPVCTLTADSTELHPTSTANSSASARQRTCHGGLAIILSTFEQVLF